MEHTREVLDAKLGLEILTISDPNVRANLMRHSAALRIMLTGRKHDSDDLKVSIGVGFGVTDDAQRHFEMLTRADGLDRIYLKFDVDDACGPPDAFGLFRLEGGEPVLYSHCRLWAPPATSRPVIIFRSEGIFGHFAYRSGETLRRIERMPADDLFPGYRRAEARLAALVASDRLREIGEPFFGIPMDQGDPG